MRIDVVAATPDDMRQGAHILNEWIDETPWMPRLHSHDEVVDYFATTIASQRLCYVAKQGQAVCAMMAVQPEDHLVTALYVARVARGMGVGSALVDTAKSYLKSRVDLWTFQTNKLAQAFYAKHGFAEVRRTEGDNEERLPDVLLRWEAAS
jgi:ribosomal protein S18 acetylase RimI-like enzyme